MESHVCQCSVCEKQGDAANARIAELEAQLAEVEKKLADEREHSEALQESINKMVDDLEWANGKKAKATKLVGQLKARLAEAEAEERDCETLRGYFDAAEARAKMADARNALLFKEKADAITLIVELEARLAEAEKKLCAEQAEHTREVLRHAITTARAERLEAALREIAEGEFNCGDWVCDAPGIAQNALDELAGPGHEGGKSE